MQGDGLEWLSAIFVGATVGLLICFVLTIASWLFGWGLDRTSMTIASPIVGALTALVSKDGFDKP